MPVRPLVAALTAAALIAAPLAGCADEIKREAAEQAGESNPPATTGTTTETARAPEPEPARCPPDLANCRSAEGEIIYVEKVDPDGDGDAHFVLDSKQSVSAPGVSIIDVRRDLRPNPLPGVGDRVSAAGPVYPGSYGQRQIEAVVVRTAYSPSQ